MESDESVSVAFVLVLVDSIQQFPCLRGGPSGTPPSVKRDGPQDAGRSKFIVKPVGGDFDFSAVVNFHRCPRVGAVGGRGEGRISWARVERGAAGADEDLPGFSTGGSRRLRHVEDVL